MLNKLRQLSNLRGIPMKNTQVIPSDFESITAIVETYFDGLHNGNAWKLRKIFHQDAWLKAPGSRRSLEQWLADVASRPIPAEQGRTFDFRLLSVDVVKDQAMVKIHCPLFDFNYIDFLGLLKEDGHWLVVSKMYTDITEDLS